MRVLLVMAKNNYPNPDQDATSFGQGIPYLAGALKVAGHDVSGINMNYLWCHGSAPLTLERLLREAIAKHSPQLIGVGGLAPDYFFVRDAIFFIRKINHTIPIVLGGGLLTYDPDFAFSFLKPDFAIIGEGELAIVKLAEYFEKGGDISSVPSLVHWKNNAPVFNRVAYYENLDEIPFPEYEPFDFDAYLSLNNQTNNYIAHTKNSPRILPLSMGRSCPFKCTFCCHQKGARYRSRSVDNVISEVAYFYKKYKFNILYMHDELFLTEKAREFCSKIQKLKKELNADFDWGCYLRVNEAEEDLLREMNDAGCKYIGLGFESASEAVLKSMKKGTTVAQMLKAIHSTQKVGIGFHANFIFGDIAETPDTIRETIAFYNQHCRDLPVFFYYITPYPGSELFQHCIDEGLIKDRQGYYEAVAFHKGGLNMTRMSDEIFRKLTEPIMSDIFNSKLASVLSCEKTAIPSCDQGAPFELRRAFYKIKIVCPHCASKVEYLYPLGIHAGNPMRSFLHFCAICHKKLMIDLGREGFRIKPEEDAYARFYRNTPYVQYYPFDNQKHTMPTVPTPQLLESHKAYNIIRYANYIYGIAQALGSFDLTQVGEERLEEFKRSYMCFVGSSVDEVKNFIDCKGKSG